MTNTCARFLLEASLLSTSTFSKVADSKSTIAVKHFTKPLLGKKASGKENRYFQEQYFPKSPLYGC